MIFQLKDNGHGITKESLKFWQDNKDKIGLPIRLEASFEGLVTENREESGVTYPVEYTCIIHGYEGTILLSGCNCGYLGTGPHGTAKILIELGLDKNKAERVIGQKTIHYDALVNEVK